MARVADEAEALLEDHQPPPLNTDVHKELDRLLETAIRDKRFPSVWLVEYLINEQLNAMIPHNLQGAFEFVWGGKRQNERGGTLRSSEGS